MATKPKRKAQAAAKAPARKPVAAAPERRMRHVTSLEEFRELVGREVRRALDERQPAVDQAGATKVLSYGADSASATRATDVALGAVNAAVERSLDGILRRLASAQERFRDLNDEMGDEMRRFDGFAEYPPPAPAEAAAKPANDGIASQIRDVLDQLHASLDVMAARVGQLKRL